MAYAAAAANGVCWKQVVNQQVSPEKVRNVLLYGGMDHPFLETSQAIAELLCAQDIETVLTTDPTEAVAELENADLLTLNTLRWRMLEDDKYQPFRKQWAYEIPESHAQAISEFVDDGGAILGLHTASICFDTWHSFAPLLGGKWRWGRTHRSCVCDVAVEPVGAHPIVANLTPFTVRDEVYRHLDVFADSRPLLRARSEGQPWQTIAWAREQGDGRVVYSALGHDTGSLKQPLHAQFIDACVAWLLGDLD